jgi:CheY-like chemotaxis protein
MGGDIAVTSAEGAGSTFTVTLPIRYAAAEARTSETAAGPRAEPEDRREDGRVVLAIDDDPDVVYLLRENLGEAGYRVVGALSGDDGLAKARALRPFAITLDIMMPDKDGWEVLRQLKADPATRDIPIIVVSIIDNRDLGFRLGAFDYVLKPLERDAILAALAHVEAHRGRLLVVDDDPDVTDMVRQLLADEPYEVDSAADGHEALEAIARAAPAVILLDLLMPRMDGFQVIQHLQQDSRYRAIPIIVLTAKTLTAAERARLDERVVTVIHKMGLERDALLGEIRAALGAFRGGRTDG